MTLKYDYVTEVLTGKDPDVWSRVYPSKLSLKRRLGWNGPAACSFEFDNHRGTNRDLLGISSKVRVTRNGVIEYTGSVQSAESSVNNGESLSVETTDYYRQLLADKVTGPSSIWNLYNVTPSDVIRSLIGTRFIVQEWFESDSRIASYNNVCVIDKALQLIRNSAAYQATGTMISKTLQNSEWLDSMREVLSLSAIITGMKASASSNLITTNPGFESGFDGWTPTTANRDWRTIEDTMEEFSSGTLTNVQAIAVEGLGLSLTGAETGDTDNDATTLGAGTLNQVTADANGLKLVNQGEGQPFNKSYDSDVAFATGTMTGTESVDNTLQLAPDIANIGWLAGYQYRKLHVVSGSADGNLTDYQVKFTIYKGSGVDSQGAAYLNGRAQSWPNDIRFTTLSGDILPYWIESSDASSATVWVKMDNIPTGNAAMYLYYGKNGDVSASNPAAMLLCDDFSGSSLDLNKWDINGSPSINVEGGVLTLIVNGANRWIQSKTGFGSGTMIEAVIKDGGTVTCPVGFGYYQHPLTGNEFAGRITYTANLVELKTQHGVTTSDSSNWTSSPSSFTRMRLGRSATSVKLWEDYTLRATLTATLPTGNVPVLIGSSYWENGSNRTVYIDKVLVRKYTENEPSHGAWAIEESKDVAWLHGYAYRKLHMMTGSSDGALSDYQVKVVINKGTGTDSAGTVYLNNHAASWTGAVPNDIRFTTTSGAQLSYWIENSDASTATVWVKLDNIPGGISSRKAFYVYYGKAADNSASDADSVFSYFNDFTDLTGWNITSGSSTYIYASDSILNLSGMGGVAPTTQSLCSTATFADNQIIEWKIMSSHFAVDSNYGEAVSMWTNSPGTYRLEAHMVGSSPYGTNYRNHNGSNQNFVAMQGWTIGAWHIMSLYRKGMGASWYVDYANKVDNNTYYPTAALPIEFDVKCPDANYYLKVDWIRTRKYTANEPAHGEWHQEETNLDSGWITGHGYRKKVLIQGSSDGAQTDYPIKLVLNSGVGSDGGTNLYLQGRCRSWPDDIRFRDIGDADLDYWVESSTATQATVWVKMHSIPVAGTAIYLYYGKDGEIAGGSNGEDIFLLFDDLSSWDASKWTALSAGTGATYADGAVQVKSGGAYTKGFTSQATFSPLTAVRFRAKHPVNFRVNDIGYMSNDLGYRCALCVDVADGWPNLYGYENRNATGNSNGSLGLALDTSNYHVFEVKRNGGSARIAIDGTVYNPGHSYEPTTENLPVGVFAYNNAAGNAEVHLEWIAVRKCAVNEPVPLMVAADETLLVHYVTEGSWQGPVESIDDVTLAETSLISWEEAMNGGDVVVQASLNGVDWYDQTSGQPIVIGDIQIADGYDCTGKYLRVKVLLSGSGNATPTVDNLLLSVTPVTEYMENGSRINIPVSISEVGKAASSLISWTGLVPTGCTLVVQASLNGVDWYDQTSGQPIVIGGTSIRDDYDCVGKTLHIRQLFATADPSKTPSLTTLSWSIEPAYHVVGNRISQAYDPGAAITVDTASITWTQALNGGTINVEARIDDGPWQVCTNGGPVPGLLAGYSLAGHTISVRETLARGVSSYAETPKLTSLTISIVSAATTVVSVGDNSHNGTNALHCKCIGSPTSWYGAESSKYAATAGTAKSLTIWTWGRVAGAGHVRLNAYDSGDVLLGSASIDISGINDTVYTARTVQYTLPVGTAKVSAQPKIESAADLWIDDFYIDTITNDIALDVSRDDGEHYYPVHIYWDGAKWTGELAFTDMPNVKNRLRYRLALNAQNGNTVTPIVKSIQLRAVTTSDTGVTEGVIEEYNDPDNSDDTITLDFADTTRDKAIESLLKITGQEAYIDPGNGQINVLNRRGGAIPRTFEIGNGVNVLSRKTNRGDMCNALTLIGAGQASAGVEISERRNKKDDDSIELYLRVERIYKEKSINDIGVLDKRAIILLDRLKDPTEEISASITDTRTRDWELGDVARVLDSTGSTGLDSVLRIVEESRDWGIDGESVKLTYSNTVVTLQEAIEAVAKAIRDIDTLAQPKLEPTPATFQDNADSEHPAKIMFKIDGDREVLDIRMSVYSDAFRAFASSTISGGGSTSGSGGDPTSSSDGRHNHTVRVANHKHFEYVRGTAGAWPLSLGADVKFRTSSGNDKLLTIGDGGLTEATTETSEYDGTHSHQIKVHDHSTPDHPHDIDFGIYEYKYDNRLCYAAARCYVNDPTSIIPVAPFGIQGSAEKNIVVTDLSIKSLYDPDGTSGPNVLAPGVNTLYIKPIVDGTRNKKGLLRLYVNIDVRYKS